MLSQLQRAPEAVLRLGVVLLLVLELAQAAQARRHLEGIATRLLRFRDSSPECLQRRPRLPLQNGDDPPRGIAPTSLAGLRCREPSSRSFHASLSGRTPGTQWCNRDRGGEPGCLAGVSPAGPALERMWIVMTGRRACCAARRRLCRGWLASTAIRRATSR